MKYLFPFGKINPIGVDEEKSNAELFKSQSYTESPNTKRSSVIRDNGVNKVNLINSSASQLGSNALIHEAAHH